MDWNTRWSNTTLDTRLPDPGVERLGEVCCWLYPYNKRLGGLQPRLQRADILPAPICMEVPGLPGEPAGSHSQHDTTHPPSRGVAPSDRDQLKLPTSYTRATADSFLRGIAFNYVLILREFLGRLMYYHLIMSIIISFCVNFKEH